MQILLQDNMIFNLTIMKHHFLTGALSHDISTLLRMTSLHHSILGDVLAHNLRRADSQQVPCLARHCSLDDDGSELGVYLHDSELADLHRGIAQLTRHLLACTGAGETQV